MLQYKTIASTTLELLTKLQQIKGLRNSRLVGGTALALQIGHRISVDLDLFTDNPEDDFLSIIAAIKSMGCQLEIRKQTSNILIAMINDIKVDIVHYPYPWLENEISENKISLASMKDIAAMKLSAITNRGTKKDFIDLYYLLKNYSLEDMLNLYQKKYDTSSIFMVLKSLTWFDDADKELQPRMFDENFDWDNVKEKITEEVKRII